jgi:hypothetical protein
MQQADHHARSSGRPKNNQQNQVIKISRSRSIAVSQTESALSGQGQNMLFCEAPAISHTQVVVDLSHRGTKKGKC